MERTSLDEDQLDLAPETPVFIQRLSWIFMLLSFLSIVRAAWLYLRLSPRSWWQKEFFIHEDIRLEYSNDFLNACLSFFLKYQPVLDFLSTLACIAMFFIAWALQLRKSIARSIFINLLYLHLVYVILRMNTVVYFTKVFQRFDDETIMSFGERFLNSVEGISIFYVVYCIILYFLYRWIHRKLTTPTILAYFKC